MSSEECLVEIHPFYKPPTYLLQSYILTWRLEHVLRHVVAAQRAFLSFGCKTFKVGLLLSCSPAVGPTPNGTERQVLKDGVCLTSHGVSISVTMATRSMTRRLSFVIQRVPL